MKKTGWRNLLSLAVFFTALAWGTALRWKEASSNYHLPLQGGDEEFYFETGTDLAKMDGSFSLSRFPGEEAYRLFLYPSLIGLTSRLWPPASPGKMRLLQMLLGILILAAVYGLGRETGVPFAGAFGALFAAGNAALISTASSLDIQGFFTLLTLLAAWAALRWLQKQTAINAAWAGCAAGISLACRSTLLLFPLALAALAALKPVKNIKKQMAALALFTLLPLAPWVLRNAIQLKEFVLLERRGSIGSFYLGSLGLIETRDLQTVLKELEKQDPSLEGKDMETRYRAMKRMAWSNIASRPLSYLRSCLQRAIQLIRYGSGFLHPVLWFLALLGIWGFRKKIFVRALVLLAAYFILVHAPIAIRPNYLFPAIPLLCLMAGLGAAIPFASGQMEKNPLDNALRWLVWLVPAAAYASGLVFLGLDILQARQSPEALAKEPQACLKLNGKAMEHFQKGDQPEALRIFSQAVQADPECIPAWIGQGALLAGQGRNQEALKSYAQAERLIEQTDFQGEEREQAAAGHAVLLASRADLHEREGKLKEALKDYKKCLQVAPSDWINRSAVLKKIETISRGF